MGELIGRSASELGTLHKPARLVLVAVAALLLSATMAASATAQDEPPKVEAPKSAPPPPEPPGQLESAPQDAQKKGSTPDEKKKDAPVAPDDKEKPAPPEPSTTQRPAPDAPGDAEKKADEQPAALGNNNAAFAAVGDLSTRYKFVERYGIADDPNQPQLLTQYRVGMLESTKFEAERPQGAPERNQRDRTIVYAERAAKVGKLGEPIGFIRRYDKVFLGDRGQPRPMNPPLLQGLTIWYQLRPPLRPQVISLTPDRPIREDEFVMIEQDLNIASLTALLPAREKRVSEKWDIPARAILNMTGRSVDDTGDFELSGTLEKVTRSEDGKGFVAEIEVAGRFGVDGFPAAFHALINFAFVPAGLALPAAGANGAASKVVLAQGSIKRAGLSLIRVASLREGQGRLKHRHTMELTLERREMTLAKGEPGPAPAPLVGPESLPTAVEANSWIVFTGPEGRFHFRHPQEYIGKRQTTPVPNKFEFVDESAKGRSALIMVAPSFKTDPEGVKKLVDEEWLRDQVTVTRGPAGWLDDADWKDSKRRVYRAESVLKQENDNPVYADIYFVVFDQTRRIVVHSYTSREDHHTVRKNVEDVIRSFQWTGPSTRTSATGAAAPATATTPSAGAPAATENPAGAASPPVAPSATPSTPRG